MKAEEGCLPGEEGLMTSQGKRKVSGEQSETLPGSLVSRVSGVCYLCY